MRLVPDQPALELLVLLAQHQTELAVLVALALQAGQPRFQVGDPRQQARDQIARFPSTTTATHAPTSATPAVRQSRHFCPSCQLFQRMVRGATVRTPRAA